MSNLEDPWASACAALDGRGVVVTGAAGGIGSAILQSFAGANLIAVDHSEESASTALATAQQGVHGGLPVGADFADPEAVDKSLKTIRAFTKDIAVLVNVAGIAQDAHLPMLAHQSLREQMQINFFAAIAYSQFAARLMARTGGGSIINITSITATDGNPGQTAYGASKAALTNATRTMSMELAGSGIRVNAVAPGVIDTQMTRSLDPEKLGALAARPSLKRLGEPSEVASVVRWLASPLASYVTGQVIRVDGCV